MRLHLAALGAALVAALAPAAGHALSLGASVDNASGRGTGCSGGGAVSGSASPVSLSGSCADDLGSSFGAAKASGGLIGASGWAVSSSGVSLPEVGGGSASYRDFVVFTSSDPSQTGGVVRMNVDLNGTFNSDTDSSAVQMSAGLFLNNVFNGLLFNETNGLPGTCAETGMSGTGFCDGSTSPTNFFRHLTTVPVFVPYNVPVLVGFDLRVSTGAYYVGSASADFFHTLSFPHGADAFILPEGVTVNAGDYLVNNRLVTSGSSAPEPAAWTLMIVGAGLIGGVFRRRDRGPRRITTARGGL